MANGLSDIGSVLGGLDDFVEVSLPRGEANDEGLRTIDANDPGNALSTTDIGNRSVEQPQTDPVTPGQQVEGQTPQGVSEPSEIATAGEDMSAVGRALGNPAVQRFLGEMGVAFSRGNPNEPGTILGQRAIESADAQQIQSVTSKLLRGEELTPQDVAGLGPQQLAQAQETARVSQEQERRETATEADIEQGEERIDIERERVSLQERAQQLRERGLELEEDALGLEEAQTEADIRQADARIAIAEKRADIQDRSTRSMIALREAQVEQAQNPSDASTAQLLRARNETIGILDERLRRERSRLEDAEDTLSEASEARDSGDFFQALFSGRDTRQVKLEEELSESDARALLEEQRKTVQQLEDDLETVSGIQAGTEQPEEDVSGVDGDADLGLGTQDNPIEVTSDSQWRALDEGQFFQANGTTYERVEGGIREIN